MAGGKFDEAVDRDVHITYDDQQKINKFAICNARLEDLKEEIKTKDNQLQNLQDAEDEMMMTLNDGDKVPFMVGEVFIMKSQDEANEAIAEQRRTLEEENKASAAKAAGLKETMSSLKADLYAKFGCNINLEPEEE